VVEPVETTNRVVEPVETTNRVVEPVETTLRDHSDVQLPRIPGRFPDLRGELHVRVAA
jgi:hypothetical protein